MERDTHRDGDDVTTYDMRDGLVFADSVEPWQLGALHLYGHELPHHLSDPRSRPGRFDPGWDVTCRREGSDERWRIDLKARQRIHPAYLSPDGSCPDPGLAIELVSSRGRPGWARLAKCDAYVFTFPPALVPAIYYVDAVALRDALPELEHRGVVRHTESKGNGTTWRSALVFVPASVLLETIGHEHARIVPFRTERSGQHAGTPIYPGTHLPGELRAGRAPMQAHPEYTPDDDRWIDRVAATLTLPRY